MQAQETTMTQAVGNNQNEILNTNRHYTPRDLINFHMLFPEKPITDDHIKNLVLGVPAVDTSFLADDMDEDKRESTAYVFDESDL